VYPNPAQLLQDFFPGLFMLYILISAIASVSVAILLKQARHRGMDAAQLITWNYLAALTLCAVIFQPTTQWANDHTLPWFSLLALSVVLPGIFLALSRSLHVAGLVKTEVAQRLSLLLSLSAAFIWFGETITPLKMAGLAVGLLAILGLITGRANNSGGSGERVWPWLLLVWMGYALVDVLLKNISAAGVPFSLSLLITFSIAFTGMMAWQLVRHFQGDQKLTGKHMAIGLVMGSLNFANIALYVLAHQSLASQPAIVFAMMNILVVVLGTLAGVAIFKEKLGKQHWIAIGAALVAIGLLALSRHL
jgi:drug/metabolite transporter (DMT)-like permease